MAILKKASFTYGELDPALHDKTDVQSYYSGLKTARNVILSKTGRVINAPGTWLGALTKDNTDVRIYVPPRPQDSILGQTVLSAIAWTRVTTTATITSTAHGFKSGDKIVVTVTSDAAAITTGIKTIIVLTVNTFTFTCLNAGAASGTISYTTSIKRDYILEFGPLYIRAYNIVEPFRENGTDIAYSLQLVDEETSLYTAADLPNLRFQAFKERDNSSDVVFVACEGRRLQRLTLVLDTLVANATGTYNGVGQEYPIIYSPPGTSVYTDKVRSSVQVEAMLGHYVEYGFTAVTKGGVESLLQNIFIYNNVSGALLTHYPKLPTNNENNSFYIEGYQIWDTVFPNAPAVEFSQRVQRINVYRRPITPSAGRPAGRRSDSSSWGLIGIVDLEGSYVNGANFSFAFIDFGQEADYTNPPPESFETVTNNFQDLSSPFDLTNGATISSSFQKWIVDGIAAYNNRLVIWKDNFLGLSKINYPRYMLRDFPLSSATALILDIGQRNPKILHVIERSGLYVFTTEGVYFGGADIPVSGLNPALKLINNAVADKDVPPIVTTYGMLFIDVSTNSIKTLVYDDNIKSVTAQDVTVFSDHLFYGRKVVSWAFQGGEVPYLFVVLDDGTACSYSFDTDTGLRGWTRHDTDGLYKEVVAYNSVNTSKSYLVFVVLRNGLYTIERSSVRALTDIQDFRTFAHSSVLYRLKEGQPATLSAVAGEWDVSVDYAIGASTTYWEARVGQTFGIWNPEVEAYYYLVLASVTPGVTMRFTIIGEALPVNLRSVALTMYECHTVITGLAHLNGKNVSIFSDYIVEGSPNNDIDSYPTYTVSAGQVTLPTPRVWSIVGLPYTSDIETLSVDSKGGSLALSAKIANEVVVRYVRTRGGYASGTFPANDKVNGMEQGYEWDTRDTINKPLAEKTRAIKYRPFSEWQLNGRICLRQVDPLPIEISSILIDVSKG